MSAFMQRRATRAAIVWATAIGGGVVAGAGCRSSDLLTVPPPAGVTNANSSSGATRAEALVAGAISLFNTAFGGTGDQQGTGGQVGWSGVLADEFTAQAGFGVPEIAVDARNAALPIGGGTGPGQYATDQFYGQLHSARLSALLAAQTLERASAANAESDIGQMFALTGYTEVFLGEDFCSGVPLTVLGAGTGVIDGTPVTADSLFAHAVAEFDSALAHARPNDTIAILARIGLGRALVDRGRLVDAQAAVAGVPTNFSFVATLSISPSVQNASFYADLPSDPDRSVANRKGGNGLDYVSAADMRMPIDSNLGATQAGTTLYYPLKFPLGSGTIVFAQGVEARLIEAEAQLAAGVVNGWAAALNALRADSLDTGVRGLGPLSTDSTTGAAPATQIDVLFRERAFWLFGTGHRLGDMRRLIRQYGRSQNTVFSVGPYPLNGAVSGAPAQYGTDINFPIGAVEQQNPNFHGCLSRGA